MENSKTIRLAQSASALGAGILGFGLGAKWGAIARSFALWIIVAGAVFHVAGMYVMQMKDVSNATDGIAKVLWVSAWICLLLLIGIMGYLLMSEP